MKIYLTYEEWILARDNKMTGINLNTMNGVKVMPSIYRDIIKKYNKWTTKDSQLFMYHGILLAERIKLPDLSTVIVEYFGLDISETMRTIKVSINKSFAYWERKETFIHTLINSLIENKYEYFSIYGHLLFYYTNDLDDATMFSLENGVPLYRTYSIDNVDDFIENFI